MTEEQKGSNIVQFPKTNSNEEFRLTFLERIWKTLEKYFSKLDSTKVKNKKIKFIFSIFIMIIMIIEVLLKEILRLVINTIKIFLSTFIRIIKFIYIYSYRFLKFSAPIFYSIVMKTISLLHDAFVLFFITIKRV
jgi:hypothetical protein